MDPRRGVRLAVAASGVAGLVLLMAARGWGVVPPPTRSGSPAGAPLHAPGPTPSTRPLDPERRPVPPTARPRPARYLLVHVESSMPITARPGGGRVVGVMAATSRYFHVPIVAWVLETSAGGRYGRVPVPFSGTDRTGWISLRGLSRSWTSVMVRVSLSRHRLVVLRAGRIVLSAPAATGAPSSPTPTGRFFVTDRVATGSPSGPFGAYAFGLSGIQTHLPAGWAGGDQLAIHGTNDPASIGHSASAGCLRVSHRVLMRLVPLLQLGTPVVIGP